MSAIMADRDTSEMSQRELDLIARAEEARQRYVDKHGQGGHVPPFEHFLYDLEDET